ncbi:saccharopine dehydrogenase-like NADP-dependent oxidoreductase [Rhodoferax ferrireducens]|uniref:Saccharopine dehydrogenase-like NADP-dependent oxidoreductase n=1 Tax=Rhodoferax ferrireducens TaxID=192843 RepID=A0ABU2C5J3_9BURK|nr:saccharopine dehydrogenase NADP-binding domain-containing protein [Rhodoferax ferrireducens]MDR7376611.1 saccharopine dehydrogenase-like NADP-dependent oxidoreductase [Rhodoferax ferrireducens]
MKTLVLGGYGNFGARICRALAGDASIQLLVGGRDVQRARALAGELGHGAQGVAIDHTAANFAQSLRALGVELLIHTAGPFQQQDYAVAQAAAEAGAHYLDLADGRRFVCDFSTALQARFQAAGRTAVSGASTVPALSSAVVEHLCQGWQRIDTIDICIAPAQTAPRGKATLAGVLSYCGEPISVWSGGQWRSMRGWGQLTPVRFARLSPRLGALCDIPDLELFPARYGVAQRVMFRAALEVGLAQRAFAVLAALRSWRLMPQPAVLAGLLNRTATLLDFMGTALGGMVVRVQGLNGAGQAARRAWHIAADNDHGPEIPCMAAILLARRLARAEPMPVGAMPCMGLLKLEEFGSEFVRWGMVTEIVAEGVAYGA